MSKKAPKEKVKQYIKDLLKKAEEDGKRLKEKEKEAAERISYAKGRLIQDTRTGFFAILLFKMPCFPVYSQAVPTMGTDGTVLIYNPLFVCDIPKRDIQFVLLHEIEHVFLQHHLRGPITKMGLEDLMKKQKALKKKGKASTFLDKGISIAQHKHKEWNYAADYVINDHAINKVKLPISSKLRKAIKYDPKYHDTTAEKVYDEIKTPWEDEENENSSGGGSGMGHDEGDIGQVFPAGFGELDEDEVKEIKQDLEKEVRAAVFSTKRAGNLPAGVENVIDSMYKTRTPWQDVFRTIFTSIDKQDYTYNLPNKRYGQHMLNWGVIMPSTYGEEYCNVGLIFDTSGSIGEKEKAILASEMQNILEDYNVNIHVLCCDTKAYTDDVRIYTPEDIKNGKLEIKLKGGGGTMMKPAFDYFKKNHEEHEFQVVICMTDMYLFDWGKLGKKPPFNVYWAMLPGYKKVDPDWGTRVEIILEKD